MLPTGLILCSNYYRLKFDSCLYMIHHGSQNNRLHKNVSIVLSSSIPDPHKGAEQEIKYLEIKEVVL